MIKYALICQSCQHAYDGWFSGSNAYDDQKARNLVECPSCASTSVEKQIMAPAVRTQSTPKGADEARHAMAAFAKQVREHVSQNFEYVGSNFANEARAMHYGEKDEKPVWGQTTIAEAKDLADEGIATSPLPEPFAPEAPPEQKKLN